MLPGPCYLGGGDARHTWPDSTPARNQPKVPKVGGAFTKSSDLTQVHGLTPTAPSVFSASKSPNPRC